MKRPIALLLYRGLSRLLGIFAPLWLQMRLARDKEIKGRMRERLGVYTKPGSAGRLIWIHGASVGECQLALALADELRGQQEDYRFLFTSQTITAASLLATQMQDDDLHQFAPLDTPAFTRRFIDHWQPDLGIFLESELWPNLILAAKSAGVPLALVNARMNKKSRNNWKIAGTLGRYLFGLFSWIMPADAATAGFLENLLARKLPRYGNAKQLMSSLPVSKEAVARFQKSINTRPVVLAASTHAYDEQSVLEGFSELLAVRPDALLILCPRHPNRADLPGPEMQMAGIAYTRHSKNELPSKQVFLADTIGEMALWLTLCNVVFMGGSLGEGKGHNPLEAIASGKPVLSGPNTQSFAQIYAELTNLGAARIINDAHEFAIAVQAVFDEPGRFLRPVLQAQIKLQQDRIDLVKRVRKPLLELAGGANARS